MGGETFPAASHRFWRSWERWAGIANPRRSARRSAIRRTGFLSWPRIAWCTGPHF